MQAMFYGAAFKEIEQWVDVNSPQGQDLLENPHPRFALFDPQDCPAYDPQTWNFSDPKANCLGYAFDAMGANLQPGRILPPAQQDDSMKDVFNMRANILTRVTAPIDDIVDTVKMGLTIDGLTPVTQTQDLYKPGHYLIGMLRVTQPHHDVHFVRLDENGLWSHFNFGSAHVRNRDFDDDTIKNPASTKLGTGLEFEAFYHVPKGGLKTHIQP